MEHKRLTLFAGHYGSGKTNIAVNYALALAKEGKRVCIADLDIVNPYFRTKDSAAELEAAGVTLVSPQFANTNVDLPALPAEAYRLVTDKNTYGIMDIGGDDRGAYALGRYVPFIKEELDIIKGFTTKGIHRDDFIVYINGKEVEIYGSQGQHRTAILSLKLSELKVIYDEIGEYPILLLDDFMSELDDKRRKNFLNNIKDIQVIITCTEKITLENLEYFSYNVIDGNVIEQKEE